VALSTGNTPHNDRKPSIHAYDFSSYLTQQINHTIVYKIYAPHDPPKRNYRPCRTLPLHLVEATAHGIPSWKPLRQRNRSCLIIPMQPCPRCMRWPPVLQTSPLRRGQRLYEGRFLSWVPWLMQWGVVSMENWSCWCLCSWLGPGLLRWLGGRAFWRRRRTRLSSEEKKCFRMQSRIPSCQRMS
jgi:hypothetical protein